MRGLFVVGDCSSKHRGAPHHPNQSSTALATGTVEPSGVVSYMPRGAGARGAMSTTAPPKLRQDLSVRSCCKSRTCDQSCTGTESANRAQTRVSDRPSTLDTYHAGRRAGLSRLGRFLHTSRRFLQGCLQQAGKASPARRCSYLSRCSKCHRPRAGQTRFHRIAACAPRHLQALAMCCYQWMTHSRRSWCEGLWSACLLVSSSSSTAPICRASPAHQGIVLHEMQPCGMRQSKSVHEIASTQSPGRSDRTYNTPSQRGALPLSCIPQHRHASSAIGSIAWVQTLLGSTCIPYLYYRNILLIVNRKSGQNICKSGCNHWALGVLRLILTKMSGGGRCACHRASCGQAIARTGGGSKVDQLSATTHSSRACQRLQNSRGQK